MHHHVTPRNVAPSAGHVQRPIPDHAKLSMYGLLSCSPKPLVFEIYSWKTNGRR